MQDFRDKVVVVTGGASGIGRALGKAFLAEGAKLVVADVEQAALDTAAGELAADGGDVMAVVAGIKSGDFVVMIGRERMEAQLVERAKKLARGECPTVVLPGFG